MPICMTRGSFLFVISCIYILIPHMILLDSVPRHRFDISNAAIDNADGILCIGTSLAVHSAFRLVKRGIEQDIPVAILNVGKTRVEKEELGNSTLVTKLETPIGETLNELVEMLDMEK